MTGLHWYALALAVVSSVVANIALKSAVDSHDKFDVSEILSIAFDFRFLIGLIACVVLFVSYFLSF